MEKLLKHEKARFLVVGCLNTGLDFLLLNTIVFVFGIYPLVANTISVTLGITISYVLNHKFVFRSDEEISLRKYITFFAVTGFSSIVIQNSIIYGFEAVGRMHFGHLILMSDIANSNAFRLNVAKATAVLIGMVWNFVFYKFVVFRKKGTTIVDDLIIKAD